MRMVARTEHALHGEAHGRAHRAASARGYMTGFLLSVILTAVPFWLVMTGVRHDALTIEAVVTGLAAVQIVVHMVFFLHMDVRSEGGWTMLALIFTLLLTGVMLSGSLWVMYHLNANMMPMSAEDMRNMP